MSELFPQNLEAQDKFQPNYQRMSQNNRLTLYQCTKSVRTTPITSSRPQKAIILATISKKSEMQMKSEP